MSSWNPVWERLRLKPSRHQRCDGFSQKMEDNWSSQASLWRDTVGSRIGTSWKFLGPPSLPVAMGKTDQRATHTEHKSFVNDAQISRERSEQTRMSWVWYSDPKIKKPRRSSWVQTVSEDVATKTKIGCEGGQRRRWEKTNVADEDGWLGISKAHWEKGPVKKPGKNHGSIADSVLS